MIWTTHRVTWIKLNILLAVLNRLLGDLTPGEWSTGYKLNDLLGDLTSDQYTGWLTWFYVAVLSTGWLECSQAVYWAIEQSSGWFDFNWTAHTLQLNRVKFTELNHPEKWSDKIKSLKQKVKLLRWQFCYSLITCTAIQVALQTIQLKSSHPVDSSA